MPTWKVPVWRVVESGASLLLEQQLGLLDGTVSGRACRAHRQDQQRARQQVQRHHQVHAVGGRARGRVDRAGDRRADGSTQVAQAADQRDAAGRRHLGQVLAGDREEQRRRRGDADHRHAQAEHRADEAALRRHRQTKADGSDHRAGQEVPAPLLAPLGTAADDHHADDAHDVRDGRVDADHEKIVDAPALDQRGHPEHHRVGCAQQQEVHQRQQVHLGVTQHLPQRAVGSAGHQASIVLEVVAQHLLLGRLQPMRVFGFVLQIQEGHDAQHRRRQALHQEQPLPAVPAIDAVHPLHDAAGQRPGDDPGDGRRGHEDGDHLSTLCRRVPEGQVQDDAGEEAGLEGAEQEAQHVELHRRGHEHHARGDDAPAEHDSQQRLARADLLEHQIAGHFEEEVADEEDAGAQAVDGVAEGQRLLHLQLRVADVDAVEVGDEVADDQQRHDAPADLRKHRLVARRVRPAACHRVGGDGARARRCLLRRGTRLPTDLRSLLSEPPSQPRTFAPAPAPCSECAAPLAFAH